MNSASAAVGGESIKTILAIVSAGIVGTKVAFNENYFRDKTSELLVLKMEKLRSEKKYLINQRMTKDKSKYTLREGLSDIKEYYSCGRIEYVLDKLIEEQARTVNYVNNMGEGLQDNPKPLRDSNSPHTDVEKPK